MNNFFRQCDNKFPDGSICDANAEEITQADPENCWKFYRCHGGCVTHEMCELNYKYDDRYAWCTYPWVFLNSLNKPKFGGSQKLKILNDSSN